MAGNVYLRPETVAGGPLANPTTWTCTLTAASGGPAPAAAPVQTNGAIFFKAVPQGVYTIEFSNGTDTIDGGSVIVASTGEVSYTDPAGVIPAGSVGTAELADGAVTSGKLDATINNDLAAASSHIGASAQVHGLPANVNVLGDRDAAGTYVQSGSSAGSGTAGGAGSWTTVAMGSITFPVAFAAVPRVFVTVTGGNNVGPAYAGNVTTSGFTANAMAIASQAWNSTFDYMAKGN